MNKKIITLLVVLLFVILAVAYVYISNMNTVNKENKDASITTSGEDFKAVDGTDEIINEIEDSINYFE